MRNIRVSVATHSFSLPLKEAVLHAARTTARGIQLDLRREISPADLTETGRRQFLHLLSENGLSVSGLELPVRRGFSDLDGLDARVEAAKRGLALAHSFRAPVVTARIGPIPEEPTSPTYERLKSVLEDLARHGNQVGATFCITTGRDPAARLKQLISSIRQGPLGVNLDPSSLIFSDQNPSEFFREIHEYVRQVMIRDGIRDLDGAGMEVPPGQGEVRWAELFQLLQEAEFKQWCVVDRTTGEDRGGDVARGVEFVKKNWK